ncbi:uncharacterized protein FIBRA_02717 [Fibroporia radiculosa]|uniref:CASTOR ACT domain-containing protein n=1 Tax=Fibroporia radiculosa TaxID=599839 RepID=J4G2G3_9APHY|nr:uncharacterized protein FIBRA_02717 [Fibroporia radiculosa]CCM00678.1 predicted protein [Fibroporia radiculosa]
MTDSVTIQLLPVSLALVHLPRSRLDSLTQHILRQILRPTPTFLNVTCNEIELSLFAEHHALEDFRHIARKDSRKLRLRRNTDDSAHPHSTEPRASRRPKRSKANWEPVEVSSDRWSVLQIDSHSDEIGQNSGTRVLELSTPLAAAGISILYQSSYTSDYIFVKSAKLSQVMSLLGSAGFDLYSSDPNNLTAQLSTFASPLLSPAADDGSSIHLLDLNSLSTSSNQRVDPEGGAVFTRSRSSTDATSSSSGSRGASIPPLSEMSNPLDFAPDVHPASADAAGDDLKTPAPPSKPAMSRSHSHSPSGCSVSVLAPDLTYVGLRDESAETWGLKIVKLVAFPDMIIGNNSKPSESRNCSRSSSVLRSPSLPVNSSLDSPIEHSLDLVTSSDGSGSASDSDNTTRVGPDSPKKDSFYENGDSSLFDYQNPRPWDLDVDVDTDSSSEGSYFSASPLRNSAELLQNQLESVSESESRLCRPSLAHHDTEETVSDSHHRARSVSASSSTSSTAGTSYPPLVPFFSFTRTSEGSSLTAPVSLLAALFPPNERDMVICSDELDILDSREGSPDADLADEERELEEVDGEREAQGTLRCLQIDLRKFGLDKHGLVNRFSRTLEENGINHMYNSTFKTANLLVDKAHATRAQALLRSC